MAEIIVAGRANQLLIGNPQELGKARRGNHDLPLLIHHEQRHADVIEHLLLEVMRLGNLLHLAVALISQLEEMSRPAHRMAVAAGKAPLLQKGEAHTAPELLVDPYPGNTERLNPQFLKKGL